MRCDKELKPEDHFEKYVQHHFTSVVVELKNLNEDKIKEDLDLFAEEVNRLAEEGMFESMEEDIRDILLTHVQDDIIGKMAKLLTMAIEKEDCEYCSLIPLQHKEYGFNLIKYYEDLDYMALRSEHNSLQSISTTPDYKLAENIDFKLFHEVRDGLWQAHLRYTCITKIENMFSEYSKYNFSKEMKISDVRNHLTLLEELLCEGTYIYGIINECGILSNLKDFLKKEHSMSNQISQDSDSDLLGEHWQIFEASKLLEILDSIKKELQTKSIECIGLFTDYDKQIANYRLQFYAQELYVREIEAFQNSSLNTARTFYHQFVPKEYTLNPGKICYYPDSNTGLTNPEFLLKVYGNKDYLQERAHQIGEYDIELIDEVIESVEFGSLEINQDVVKYIINSSFMHRDYLPGEIIEDKFTPKIIGRLIQEIFDQQLRQQVYCLISVITSKDHKLENLGATILSLLNEELETEFKIDNLICNLEELRSAITKKDQFDDNGKVTRLLQAISDKLANKFEREQLKLSYDEIQQEQLKRSKEAELPSLTEYIEQIQKEFTQCMSDPRIEKLRVEFNDAYERKDWLEVQKLWPVFTKFQRLLVSSDREQKKKDRSFQYGYRDFPDKKGEERPKDKSDLLEKAWGDYSRNAGKYTRIYVTDHTNTLTYSSKRHPDTKTAELNFSPVLKELTDLGQDIHDALREHKKDNKSLPNVFTPVLYFVVTDKPHKKDGDHKRIFVPVDLQPLLEGFPSLLADDKEDGVFGEKDNDAKRKIAIEDSQEGHKIMGVTDPKGFVDTKYEEGLNHSERVMIELLRNPEYVGKLIPLLQESIETITAGPLEKQGKYKIYAVALLGYSTNSICDYCTSALVSQQGSHEKGFLFHLANSLNDEKSPFKTSGYDKVTSSQNPEKLRMLSVISATHPYTEQAKNLSNPSNIKQDRIEKKRRYMENPRGTIKLPEYEIDLHQLGRDKDGNTYPSHRSFVEFVGTEFRKHCLPINNQPEFIATGHAFMSNSKKRIVGDEDALNTKLEEIMTKQQEKKKSVTEVWQSR